MYPNVNKKMFNKKIIIFTSKIDFTNLNNL